jgi:hypothetical protein
MHLITQKSFALEEEGLVLERRIFDYELARIEVIQVPKF